VSLRDLMFVSNKLQTSATHFGPLPRRFSPSSKSFSTLPPFPYSKHGLSRSFSPSLNFPSGISRIHELMFNWSNPLPDDLPTRGSPQPAWNHTRLRSRIELVTHPRNIEYAAYMGTPWERLVPGRRCVSHFDDAALPILHIYREKH
jgi:hypothetical protein